MQERAFAASRTGATGRARKEGDMPDSARQQRCALPSHVSALTSCGVLLLAAGLLLALPAALAAQEGEAFEPGGALPFAKIAAPHPVDSKCGIEGKAASDDANPAQNRPKTNLCPEGDPVAVTQPDSVGLQAAVAKAGIPSGSPKKL